jgi:RimJ/RimL family protein N-acetyltransferase
MTQIPTLTTERLLLRPFRDDDLDAYAEICADAEVMRYLGEARPLSRAEAWRQMAFFLGHWQLRGFGFWALEEKASGTLIGRAGLQNPEGWPGFEAGWTLGRPYWGHGYATEAAREMLRLGFDELGLHRIVGRLDARNTASARVLEKLGMRREARLVDSERVKGEWATELVYAMLESEWTP